MRKTMYTILRYDEEYLDLSVGTDTLIETRKEAEEKLKNLVIGFLENLDPMQKKEDLIGVYEKAFQDGNTVNVNVANTIYVGSDGVVIRGAYETRYQISEVYLETEEKSEEKKSETKKQKNNSILLEKAHSAKGVPVYTHDVFYARSHDELMTYWDSHRINVSCQKKIEDAIIANYHDYRLDTENALNDVLELFDVDRIRYVLANTVRLKDWDGRISRENKSWAQTVPIEQNLDDWGNDHNSYFIIDGTNPGLVDLFVTHFRKITEGKANGKH